MKSLITIIIVSLILSSCGSTYIITDKQNDIYINGVYKGKEKVKITRNGLPKSSTVEIQCQNKLVSETKIKRKFTLKTGLMTYFFNIFGLLTTWQFDRQYFFRGKINNIEENIWEKDPEKSNIWE